jgi:hypothetical protein
MERDGGLLNTCKDLRAIGNTVDPLPSWPPIARYSQLQRRSLLLRIENADTGGGPPTASACAAPVTPSPAAG